MFIISDPYVKVSLMCQGKRIKKKKTSVQKNTLHPVFNEALVFDVPQESVEDVYLIVKVVDYDRWAKERFKRTWCIRYHHGDFSLQNKLFNDSKKHDTEE